MNQASHSALEEERCLDVVEVSRILGVCVRTVIREIQRGRLRAFRVGRKWKIQLSELRRYMEQGLMRESR